LDNSADNRSNSTVSGNFVVLRAPILCRWKRDSVYQTIADRFKLDRFFTLVAISRRHRVFVAVGVRAAATSIQWPCPRWSRVFREGLYRCRAGDPAGIAGSAQPEGYRPGHCRSLRAPHASRPYSEAASRPAVRKRRCLTDSARRFEEID